MSLLDSITASRHHPWAIRSFGTVDTERVRRRQRVTRLGADLQRTTHRKLPTRIGEIVHGTRGISPDTALRLSRALGTSDRFWLDLQNRFDLEVALEANKTELDRIRSLIPA